ncbi:TIGR02678 family protein [Listeria sp. FSL L7-1582]|uniref:TIGR02678 family protein n=1 Tax=Listeria portnoyi TaxID=2713504 RepID=UPI00164D7E39|nr:TIGR02678 family protein [Listeria portnoyi]MBC6308959.1 TIGR02678 family protein [Listeria portnoyi]
MLTKDDKLKDGLQLLMDNYWVLRSVSPKEYQFLRSMEKDLRQIISDKFGWRVYFHTDFIKLEKIPVEPEAWMGMLSFEEPMDYALFCCGLAFFEEKDIKEYFLLSHICEEILESYPGTPKVDWLNYNHRKSLIRVIKKMLDLHLIETIDGDMKRFLFEEDAEVLYVTTVYARYFMRPYPQNIYDYAHWSDLIEDETLDSENAQRHLVYKKLFMQPQLLRGEVSEADFYYIRNQRPSIEHFAERYSEYHLELYKDVAMLVMHENKAKSVSFPSNKALDDILLHLMALVRKKDFSVDAHGEIHLSTGQWDGLLDELIAIFQFGWSKEYRDKKKDALEVAIVQHGKSWGFLEREVTGICIYPTFARFAGKYSLNGKEEVEK